MATTRTAPILTARFVEAEGNVFLELENMSDRPLKHVEVLTIFLKDEETPGGGPSRVHIRFETITHMQPKEKVLSSHTTWIDGKPAETKHDQIKRLREVAGCTRPYVLDLSWEDAEGKSRFQRIPVGH